MAGEVFPKWQYKLQAINTDTEIPQFCDDEKCSVEFPMLYWQVYYSFVSRVCDENSEVHGSNTVPS